MRCRVLHAGSIRWWNASKWSLKPAARPGSVALPQGAAQSDDRNPGICVQCIWKHQQSRVGICDREGRQEQKGRPATPKLYRLAAHNKAIRKNLSQNFQNYLKGKDEWFKQLEDFRHSLAHRMPPFVPPCTTKDKDAAYDEIQVAMDDAIARRDFDTYDEKSEQQCALGIFRPAMLHSVVETEAYIAFYPQIIADFATVEEIGRIMLAELDL